MFKYKLITFILLTAVLIPAKAFCQEVIKDQQVRVIAGNVTYADPAGGIINVQTDKGNMVFYISVESYLYQHDRHMASIEIEQGDSVIIQYVRSSWGKNNILSLVDNNPEKS
jgi:hypothetical protein